MKNQISSENVTTLPYSSIETQTPKTTAEPIIPMNCSLLMFEAMNDPPTTYQGSFFPARKYTVLPACSPRPARYPTIESIAKKPPIAR